jgi:GT2 family glycosyltransferase
MTSTAFPIQSFLAPDYGRPDVLYVRDPKQAPGFVGAAPWALAKGAVLCADSYFNSFYPDVWSRNARLGKIGIAIAPQGGALRVTVMAVTDGNAISALTEHAVDGPAHLWLPPLPVGTLRLFLRLEALSACSLDRLDWVTDQAPLCQPTLSLGLCTFNRESHLTKTLDVLVHQAARSPGIRQVTVVNQGPPFASPELRARVQDPLIRVIDQPNLGGCGGFTRGMVESLTAADPCSHHVVMDDDIILDPRALERAIQFLSYVPQDIALGAQMLEIERPTRLHEAGAILHGIGHLESIGHSLMLEDTESLQVFSPTPEIDYNAWWFCVIPLAAIRSAGLPPPLFIRGDDIEYGLRLGELGIRTIPLPGCAVWHESFVHKSADWLFYYYLRNILVISVLHPRKLARPSALFLFGLLMSVLLQHRYRQTEIGIHAISDCLSDPSDTFGPDGAARHARLMTWVATLPAAQNLGSADLPQTRPGILIPLNPSIPSMVRMCVSSIIGLHLVRFWPSRKALYFAFQPSARAVGARDYVVAEDAGESRFLLYRSSLPALWRLFFKSLAICLRYHRDSARALPAMGQFLQQARALPVWKQAFGMRSQPDTAKRPIPEAPHRQG